MDKFEAQRSTFKAMALRGTQKSCSFSCDSAEACGADSERTCDAICSIGECPFGRRIGREIDRINRGERSEM